MNNEKESAVPDEMSDEMSGEGAKHLLTTYRPYASGNNDSSTNCDICGAEV